MKYFFGILLFWLGNVHAQEPKTENIIIVTMDGMRWQEVFGGADSALLNNPNYTHEKDGIEKEFGGNDASERRRKLFPFLWNTVATQGQLYGNRNIGSNVDVANPYKFSYPGYNEIFTGYPDTAVNSNKKIKNKNTNVLEFINKQKGYQGKVAAFSTWDVAPYFLNKWRNGLYINADQDPIDFGTPTSKMLNDIQTLSNKSNGERLDIVTYISAREYLKEKKPKVLYISFDETDEYAHQGDYDHYLGAAHAEDGMLADIWKTVQSMPGYKDKTTLLVTCDHGRGDKIKSQWRDHGEKIEDAGHIWIAVIGPDTKPLGEVKTPKTLYQKQLAPTMAALLGFHFVPDHGTAETISTIVQ
ncbi:MAG: alkaline phosphatase family protein [Bacteroidetes bacterium]|nr:alkaline phosphatase family protein [Bacteroidota bacterium]